MDKPKERPPRARWPYALSSQDLNNALDDYLNEIGNDGLSLLTLDELQDVIINVLLRRRSDLQPTRERRSSPARKANERKRRCR